MKKLTYICFAFACLLYLGCDKDDPTPEEMVEELDCSTFNDSYTESIKAIIDANCAISGCHNGTNPRPDFTEYANVFESRNSIRSRVVAKSMPPASRSPLTQELIDKIDCWVVNGAPE